MKPHSMVPIVKPLEASKSHVAKLPIQVPWGSAKLPQYLQGPHCMCKSTRDFVRPLCIGALQSPSI